MEVRVAGQGGSSSNSGITLLVLGIFFLIIGALIPPLACVGLIMLIVGIVTLSTANNPGQGIVVRQPGNQMVVVPNRSAPVQYRPTPVQYRPVPIQQQTQQNVQLAQPPVARAPSQIPTPPATPIKNKAMWMQEAKNLELARNWSEAAKAYEKAGMYAEAGRIRQQNLEQNQPMVQIGQVGNTVLNDSVIIGEEQKNVCSNCNQPVEKEWNICPNCTSQL